MTVFIANAKGSEQFFDQGTMPPLTLPRQTGINMHLFDRSNLDLIVPQLINSAFSIGSDDYIYDTNNSNNFSFHHTDWGIEATIEHQRFSYLNYNGNGFYFTTGGGTNNFLVPYSGTITSLNFRYTLYQDTGPSYIFMETEWSATDFSIPFATWMPLSPQQRFNLLFSGADTITGTNLNDTIDGGAGADVMRGGLGDDVYYVDNVADLVAEAAAGGNDTVYSTVSYRLGSASFVNTLAIMDARGLAALNLTGNDYDQSLKGNRGVNTLNGMGGNDLIDGFGGADIMIGGAGNDTMNVDNTGDVVVELGGGGAADRINTSVNYTLAAGCYVEILSVASYSGTAPITLTGNAIAQRIVGNAGMNTLSGLEGNDILTGNAGADRFVFAGALNGVTNVDTITDFSVVDDTIALRRAVFTQAGSAGVLASEAFYIGAAAHDASDRILYNSATGVVSYDPDGSGAAAAVAFAKLTTGLALTAADFAIF